MKKSRIVLFVLIAIGGAIGIFSAMQPPVYLERSIEINAPSNIVEGKINAFRKNADTVGLKQFKFDYQPAGNKTRLALGYTPTTDDNDEMFFKLFWIFKKDEMAQDMDRALLNIKRISEKAALDSVQTK
jgi:hypothetical protein